MTRKLGMIVISIVVIYVSFGLYFHVRWTDELADCDRVLRERGEFVEPPVFPTPLALMFDVTYWPVYSAANIYHDGTPFATPCTH